MELGKKISVILLGLIFLFFGLFSTSPLSISGNIIVITESIRAILIFLGIAFLLVGARLPSEEDKVKSRKDTQNTALLVVTGEGNTFKDTHIYGYAFPDKPSPLLNSPDIAFSIYLPAETDGQRSARLGLQGDSKPTKALGVMIVNGSTPVKHVKAKIDNVAYSNPVGSYSPEPPSPPNKAIRWMNYSNNVERVDIGRDDSEPLQLIEVTTNGTPRFRWTFFDGAWDRTETHHGRYIVSARLFGQIHTNNDKVDFQPIKFEVTFDFSEQGFSKPQVIRVPA